MAAGVRAPHQNRSCPSTNSTGAAAVGLLKDYYKNAVESYEVLQEQLLTPQVMTDPEGFLSRYLSAHLARLSDEEVATLTEIFWQEGNESGVRRCAQLVTQRARSQRQRIAQERRLRRNAHLAPLVKVRALLPNCATESLVDLSLLRRDNGYAGFRHGFARDLILTILMVCTFGS